MLKAREKDAFSHVGFQKQVLFLIGEFKCLLYTVNGGRRLFEQELDRGVGNHGDAIRGVQEVPDVLCNCGKSEEIFSATFGDAEEKGRRVFCIAKRGRKYFLGLATITQ